VWSGRRYGAYGEHIVRQLLAALVSAAELKRRFARIGRPFPPAYLFQAGRPEEVRRAYEEAMGAPACE
jgi:hypothetical protein